MKIATWNVNSVRSRLAHLRDWIGAVGPDVVALQETKTADANFPVAELAALGYQVACCGQKSYNGVAVLSRRPLEVLFTELADFADPQRRVLAVRAGDLTLVNVYVPNGASVGSDKYAYKLTWLEHLHGTLRPLVSRNDPLLVLGDFNVAPEDRDVHDPAAWAGSVLVSEPERERLRHLFGLGMADCYRLFGHEGDGFTWWDYRAGGFRRNHGLRIDLVLADERTAARCLACDVDRTPRAWDRPSDHAPVVAEYAF